MANRAHHGGAGSPLIELHLRIAEVLPRLRRIASDELVLGFAAESAETCEALELMIKHMHRLADRISPRRPGRGLDPATPDTGSTHIVE